MEAFSSECTCIAFDTPGYGQSDLLMISTPSLRDYGDALLTALTEIGIEQFCLYGAATGSQIAIQMAKDAPERIHFLMLDSNGHVSADERDTMLEGYFPNVTPRRDGGHLLTYWDMVKSLFVAFPWTSGNVADQLKFDSPPPEVLQEILMRHLQAGTNYALAYKEAFYKENIDHLVGLDVPTVMTRWEDSAVLSIMDALLEHDLPNCVRVLEAGNGVPARFGVQKHALSNELRKRPIETAALSDQRNKSQKGWQKKYFSAGDTYIHGLEKTGSGEGTVILLHAAGGSAMQILDRHGADYCAGQVIALDLPSHGYSAPVSNIDQLSLQSVAAPILSAIKSVASDSVQLVGEGLGAAVALSIADSITAKEVSVTEVAPRFKVSGADLPDLTPKYDGTHLVSMWAYLKDRRFYEPWNQRTAANRRNSDAELSAEVLQNELFDLLRVGKALEAFALLEASQTAK